MSNIYIQEPPTFGKVLLVTSVGDIDVELWSRETPKACRNFVQLCMEGYYDGTIFHRLVSGFIVQGGDPTGTGEGGESIYGKTFRDEFHSRLRFNRRGLLGMANAGLNDNASQFFFTLGEAQELNNKHTLFGKITGDTVFNMLKMADLETDQNERPIFPPKIIKTKILNNPFTDIEPRDLPKRSMLDETKEKKKKSQSKATKDFKLLSFGEEAEEDEEATLQVSSKMKGKSKSSHDLVDDPHLSKLPAVDPAAIMRDNDDDDAGSELPENKKRKLSPSSEDVTDRAAKKAPLGPSRDSEIKQPSKIEKLRQESDQLKRDLRRMRDSKAGNTDSETIVGDQVSASDEVPESDAISEYKEDLAKYSHVRRTKQLRGTDRETATLAIMKKFQEKLTRDVDEEDDIEVDPLTKQVEPVNDDDDEDEDEEQDLVGTSWMLHKFVSTDERKNKVIDANIYDADRYAIYDPRNPLNQRKLEASKEKMKERQKKDHSSSKKSEVL